MAAAKVDTGPHEAPTLTPAAARPLPHDLLPCYLKDPKLYEERFALVTALHKEYEDTHFQDGILFGDLSDQQLSQRLLAAKCMFRKQLLCVAADQAATAKAGRPIPLQPFKVLGAGSVKQGFIHCGTATCHGAASPGESALMGVFSSVESFQEHMQHQSQQQHQGGQQRGQLQAGLQGHQEGQQRQEQQQQAVLEQAVQPGQAAGPPAAAAAGPVAVCVVVDALKITWEDLLLVSRMEPDYNGWYCLLCQRAGTTPPPGQACDSLSNLFCCDFCPAVFHGTCYQERYGEDPRPPSSSSNGSRRSGQVGAAAAAAAAAAGGSPGGSGNSEGGRWKCHSCRQAPFYSHQGSSGGRGRQQQGPFPVLPEAPDELFRIEVSRSHVERGGRNLSGGSLREVQEVAIPTWQLSPQEQQELQQQHGTLQVQQRAEEAPAQPGEGRVSLVLQVRVPVVGSTRNQQQQQQQQQPGQHQRQQLMNIPLVPMPADKLHREHKELRIGALLELLRAGLGDTIAFTLERSNSKVLQVSLTRRSGRWVTKPTSGDPGAPVGAAGAAAGRGRGGNGGGGGSGRGGRGRGRGAARLMQETQAAAAGRQEVHQLPLMLGVAQSGGPEAAGGGQLGAGAAAGAAGGSGSDHGGGGGSGGSPSMVPQGYKRLLGQPLASSNTVQEGQGQQQQPQVAKKQKRGHQQQQEGKQQQGQEQEPLLPDAKQRKATQQQQPLGNHRGCTAKQQKEEQGAQLQLQEEKARLEQQLQQLQQQKQALQQENQALQRTLQQERQRRKEERQALERKLQQLQQQQQALERGGQQQQQPLPQAYDVLQQENQDLKQQLQQLQQSEQRWQQQATELMGHVPKMLQKQDDLQKQSLDLQKQYFERAFGIDFGAD